MDRKENLKQTSAVYKYLPGMKPSTLSLNDYRPVDLRECWLLHGRDCGADVYSYSVLAAETERVFEAYDGWLNGDVMAFLTEKTVADISEAAKVWGIVDRVAAGLASIFASLRRGSPESRASNSLTAEDWEFWSRCSHVFLVGKLAEGKLGQCLEERLAHHLNTLGEHGISVRCFENPQNKTASLLGCAKTEGVCENRVFVFDFGNTAVKRGRAMATSVNWAIDELPSIIHCDYGKLENNIQNARKLHSEIAGIIRETIEHFGEECPSYAVSLCMANNIVNGEIMDRGSYRSLRLLSKTYDKYLKQYLEQTMGKPITLHMINDAQAAANLFREWSPRAAVVTLGTHMGIAYP